jgi:hypothetical protein
MTVLTTWDPAVTIARALMLQTPVNDLATVIGV